MQKIISFLKNNIYLILAVVLIVLILGALIFYIYYITRKMPKPPQVEKTLYERQIEELDSLRAKPNPNSEGVTKQLEELNKLRK